jgi:hypothetical protein
VKKEIESAIKMAKAIATMRESGLEVTDETLKGGSIGITGVHDRREECTELGMPTKYCSGDCKDARLPVEGQGDPAMEAGVSNHVC